MKWLEEFTEEEISKELTNDTALVFQYCGFSVLRALWSELPSMNIFVSTKPLTELKKRYIKKHWNKNAKELAALLNVSERFVYDIVQDREIEDKQGKLL